MIQPLTRGEFHALAFLALVGAATVSVVVAGAVMALLAYVGLEPIDARGGP